MGNQELERPRLYQQLVENIGERFVIFSHKVTGELVYVSPGMKSVFGVEPEAALNKSWGAIINWLPESKMVAEAEIEKFAKGETDYANQFEMSFIHPNGELRTINVTNHAERDETGEAILVGGIVENITEKKHLIKKLEEAKNLAVVANQAKSEFLARMSHELRTPMNAILGFGQLLELDSEDLTDRQMKNLERISSAGNHLLELIDEVLDLSKIESGKMELSIEVVDIISIVDEVLLIVKPLTKENHISLKHQKIPASRYFAELDKLRFKQILLNLVSNAIKYNKPNGSVTVSYEIQEKGMIRLGIWDTGDGIPVGKRERLFKPFERFHLDAEKIKGTGIGLTISKQLVELMKGTIGFESTPGEGSYFYVDVPITDKVPLIQSKEEPGLLQPFLSNDDNKKVLYIEDIKVNVELMREMLNRRKNISLLSASNGLEGIELAKSESPDLILMDIHMPGMDGFATFQKLQEINETKNIPVIALTADAMDGDIKKALNLGFEDYITKPINMKRLLEFIDRVFA